jgi:hypothetical protein
MAEPRKISVRMVLQPLNQCKNDGWKTFNTPPTFKNRGDCIQYVNTGK